ncbi:hypothetical protein [Sphingomonas sp. Leaf17]|uniref:hypothetical protein n=1 Tax=Sphingomonas sp. Leaf17 TaxID=1735683 RepID=UPI0012E29F3B|nr:hypothetical protein [Sphingomonas sp. Leaf17]
MTTLTAILLAAPVQGQQATTIQQDFEAATALADKGDHVAALAAWERLEQRTASKRRSLALVQVRKSATLLALNRKDESVAAARAGLAGLPAADKTLQEDRFTAYFNIARVAQNAIDYAGAATAYAQAEGASDDPGFRLAAMIGQADVLTYVAPTEAAKAMARAEALAATIKVSKSDMAEISRRKGLLLLNTGAFEAARQASIQAVTLRGGMTEKTDLRDVAVRSDAAIASLLVGRTDDARRYMAMTGAGRITKGDFTPGAEMTVPDCGGDAGLKPADMAVVEFSIGDDGSVLQAAPIYAVGGGEAALTFARAARDWSWTPEQVKTMPAFFRYGARVEMRCSTAFQRPSIVGTLRSDLAHWLDERGAPALEPVSDKAVLAIAAQRAALATGEGKAGRDALTLMSPIYALIENPIVGNDERNALAARALAIAVANGAPPSVRLGLDMMVRQTAKLDRDFDAVQQIYRRMLDEPVYASDARTRSVLRLMQADHEKPRVAKPLLENVANDPALDASDPLRVGALVRLASLEQTAGDTAAARAAFEKSGLTADQCALLDAPPRQLKTGGVFPEEAQGWGFEGWTSTQFDIGADGRVLNERAVLSYPPFVFTKAGVAAITTSRFAKSFRPDGGLGCGGTTRRIRFTLGR